jgi:glycosyltransferase involved in cell wall biosynthesis
VTIHDLGHLRFPEAHPPMQRLYHRLSTRWNARVAHHVFADSEATRDDLVDLLQVPGAKITVIYPALASEWCSQRPRPEDVARVRDKYQIGTNYILAVGTVHPRKNYFRLIEAFNKMREDGLVLVVAGRQSWRHQVLLRHVNTLGLETAVRFLDYVFPSDMPLLMTGARMLAFPSLHEGFGLPVLEAHACRTPVVTSMTSSLPEVAGDGALFVDPFDVEAIAAALERVHKDHALRSKLIENGLRNYVRFSWDASAVRILESIQR